MKTLKVIVLVLVIITVIGELLSAFGDLGVQILSIVIPVVLVLLVIRWLSARNHKKKANSD